MNTTVNIFFSLHCSFEVIHPGAQCMTRRIMNVTLGDAARVSQHFWASEIGHFKQTSLSHIDCPHR